MTDSEKPRYSDCIARIEEILHQIETGELDVDELASRVKTASELLKICQEKLFGTENEVQKVLKGMDTGETGT